MVRAAATLFFTSLPPARSPACLSRAVFGIFNMLLILPVMRWAFLAPVTLGSAGVFGFTVGVSIFGTAYMVVHDGVVHGRFWTGSLGQVESIRRVAEAHKMHHRLPKWARLTACSSGRTSSTRRRGVSSPPRCPSRSKAACWAALASR